jgi:hypothetical protein
MRVRLLPVDRTLVLLPSGNEGINLQMFWGEQGGCADYRLCARLLLQIEDRADLPVGFPFRDQCSTSCSRVVKLATRYKTHSGGNIPSSFTSDMIV